MGVGAAQVGIEGQAGRLGGGAGDGQRAAQDGVGAKVALVGGAVGGDHGLVAAALVGGVHAHQELGQLVVDVVDGLGDALAHVAVLVAVAQLNGLELAGGGAGGDNGAAKGAVLQKDLDLDGGVAAGVKDLATVNVGNDCHTGHLSCVSQT